MTPRKTKVEAPDHLRPSTARWYTEVCKTFDLESHHKLLLQTAAESWDLYQTAREEIATKGMTYSDKAGQPRTRPEIKVANDAKITFMRALRETGLDLAEPEQSKPPTITKGII